MGFSGLASRRRKGGTDGEDLVLRCNRFFLLVAEMGKADRDKEGNGSALRATQNHADRPGPSIGLGIASWLLWAEMQSAGRWVICGWRSATRVKFEIVRIQKLFELKFIEM